LLRPYSFILELSRGAVSKFFPNGDDFYPSSVTDWRNSIRTTPAMLTPNRCRIETHAATVIPTLNGSWKNFIPSSASPFYGH